MKFINFVVGAFVTATFFALILSPAKWGWRLMLVCTFVVGFWMILFPQGALGWRKTAYSWIEPDNPSYWPTIRFIGWCSVAFAVLLLVAFGW
jgi:hypothetical protein